jgi:hypothetical protein
MDVLENNGASSESTTSSTAECEESYSGVSTCDIEEAWFEHGINHGMLKAHCLAMSREFHREPKNAGSKCRSLAESIEDAQFHASEMATWIRGNATDGGLSGLKREKEMWGALATLFLENRMKYLNVRCFGKDLPVEDEIDGRRKWPPNDLPVDWFEFEKSFELLQCSCDALIHECTINNIRLPCDCEGNEKKHDFDTVRGAPILEVARKLRTMTLTDAVVKSYWRSKVSIHLDDLFQFYSEMAFANTCAVACAT